MKFWTRKEGKLIRNYSWTIYWNLSVAMLISFPARTVDQSIARCGFCNIKLQFLWWSDRATINSKTNLTGGLCTLGKMTLEWSDLVRFLEVNTFPKYSVYLSEILPKYCHSCSGVLASFERPLSCVREFKSSLLMSPAVINLAFRRDSKNAFAGIN